MFLLMIVLMELARSGFLARLGSPEAAFTSLFCYHPACLLVRLQEFDRTAFPVDGLGPAHRGPGGAAAGVVLALDGGSQVVLSTPGLHECFFQF